MTYLSLSYKSIGFDGTNAIAKALKDNTAVLTELFLQGNSIGDHGAEAIADALQVDRNLTTLHLSDVSIGVKEKILS